MFDTALDSVVAGDVADSVAESEVDVWVGSLLGGGGGGVVVVLIAVVVLI